MDFDVANFTVPIPFAGTELFEIVGRGGRFLIDTTRNLKAGFYGRRVFYELGNLDQTQVLRRYATADREFYSFRKKLRMAASIRSWAEVRWHFDVMCPMLKGMNRGSSDA
jgi:hypothetical protein